MSKRWMLLAATTLLFTSACDNEGSTFHISKECTNGEKKCDSNKFLQCIDHTWQEKAVCSGDKVCDINASDGCATPAACTQSDSCAGLSQTCLDGKCLTIAVKSFMSNGQELSSIDKIGTDVTVMLSAPLREDTDAEVEINNGKLGKDGDKATRKMKLNLKKGDTSGTFSVSHCDPSGNVAIKLKLYGAEYKKEVKCTDKTAELCTTHTDCSKDTDTCVQKKCVPLAVKEITGHDGSDFILTNGRGKHKVILNGKAKKDADIKLSSDGDVAFYQGISARPLKELSAKVPADSDVFAFTAQAPDKCISVAIKAQLNGEKEVSGPLRCHASVSCATYAECKDDTKTCSAGICIPLKASAVTDKEGKELKSVTNGTDLSVSFNGLAPKDTSIGIIAAGALLTPSAEAKSPRPSIEITVLKDKDKAYFHLDSCSDSEVTLYIKTNNSLYRQSFPCESQNNPS